MPERRALVVATDRALAAQRSGASLRVGDVVAVLEEAELAVTLTSRAQLPALGAEGPWDLGVAVSFASAPALRTLSSSCRRTWLDAVDSWRLLDLGGLRAGHPSYAARLVRDAGRLVAAPTPDLATWISRRDLLADHRLVRARTRLVLPGRVGTAAPAAAERPDGRRLVVAGDWDYPPNRDGLRWLVRRVLPHLAHPVEVFGPGTVPAVAGLVHRGYVADPAALLRQGDVHLAPVGWGSGVKRKVLDPLLAGLPVVARPAAAHGLRPHPLLHVNADAADFAAAASTALGRPAPAPGSAPAPEPDGDDHDAVLGWLRGG